MSTELSPIGVRARIHAALGDPARLAIADTLALADASPSDIAADLGMATNLLAHHLNVLATAGVIERHRSEHDHRRSYLRLLPAAHSVLAKPTLPAPHRVVFICTRYSARSQLAAAVWARQSHIRAASAGTHPAPRVHPRAVRIARRRGIPLDATRTARLDAVAQDGDLFIAVCDHVHETLPADHARLHWSVRDPVPIDTDDAFEAAYTDLAERIDRLATAILAKETRP